MLKWRGRLSLRFTLLSLLVGLLLLTVASLALVAHFSANRASQELEARSFRIAALAISSQLGSYLEPAIPLLQEARLQALRGRLPVDDPEAVGDYLVERLRHQRGVGWFSYSDHATGRFVGAWRRADGAIILNRSSPDVDGGLPSEFEVTPDGQRIPFHREVKPGYDPRRQGWYQQATGSEGIIWTEPFEFNEGVMGITAALALRAPGSSQPLGVFTADFFLDDVSRFLEDVAESTRAATTRVLVVTRGGKLLAGSESWPADEVDQIVASVPGGLDALAVETPAAVFLDLAGVPYAGAFQAFRVPGGVEWVAGVLIPENEVHQVVYENRRDAVRLGLIFVLIAVVVGWLVADRIARPLHAMSLDLREMAHFKFPTHRSPTSFVEEIAVVSDSVDRMKASLLSFGRYVPTELVQNLIETGREARLGGEYRQITVYFSDIEGFTQIGEQLEPARLVEHLGEYLEAMTAVIREEEGMVDKFVGDGILAFFNTPRDQPDHAVRASRAALRSQEELQRLAKAWREDGKPVLRHRIGLHFGEVLVGNIGTPDRFEYTAMGDAVNLASRLEQLNKVYGTTIIASDEVRAKTGLDFEWRILDRVAVVGRGEGTLVSELLGERGRVEPEILHARDVYEEALTAYFTGRFTDAAAGFRRAATLRPGDRATEHMAIRAEALATSPPADGWNGVYSFTEK
jgi:adenylate cyclase